MAETATDPREVVVTYAEALNERDLSKVPDVAAESFTLTSPVSGTVHGRENVETHFREIVDGFSGFRITIHEMVAGENLVMTESTLSGTHDGEFDGVPPTRREFEIPEMATFVVEDGKPREERTYFDRHDFLDQLGLVDE